MKSTDITYDQDGLITAVVQDAVTRQVRMVGWMSPEAVELTATTGQVHFWSRSRQTLWRKGETSGNTLNVVEMVADCDGDTLLVNVDAAGPTCHTGAETCFGDHQDNGFAWLEHLNATITQRIVAGDEASYTVSLVADGVGTPARKVLEEAGEVAFAAKDHAVASSEETEGALISEAADLAYHLLVLLAERQISPSAVIAELQQRSGRKT